MIDPRGYTLAYVSCYKYVECFKCLMFGIYSCFILSGVQEFQRKKQDSHGRLLKFDEINIGQILT